MIEQFVKQFVIVFRLNDGKISLDGAQAQKRAFTQFFRKRAEQASEMERNQINFRLKLLRYVQHVCYYDCCVLFRFPLQFNTPVI